MYTLLKKLCYAYLKFLVGIAQPVYFRRIEINGDRKTAADQAAVYAVRHANALMDPLMVSPPVPRSLYFLARGDIFGNKAVARVLDMINMIPIFRIRDGGNSIDRNAATFARCRALLAEGAGIQIFPEGEHSAMHKLLPLKKGAARITMPALDAHPDLQVAVVPVGLNYSDERKFRASVSLNFGAALAARDYFDPADPTSEDNIAALTSDMEAALRVLVLDLRDPAPYEKANALREALEMAQFGLQNPKFAESKALCEQIVAAWAAPDKREKLADLASEHAELRTQSGLVAAGLPLENVEAQPSMIKRMLLIIFAPLFLLGSLLHAPMLLLANRAPRLIKDDIFFAAVRMVSGILLTKVLYLIYFIVAWCVLGSGLWALVVLATIVGSGLIALPCYDILQDWRRSRRIQKFTRQHATTAEKLRSLQQEILDLLQTEGQQEVAAQN